jgi:diguanylate cyclase (GGDEF)-like protein
LTWIKRPARPGDKIGLPPPKDRILSAPAAPTVSTAPSIRSLLAMLVLASAAPALLLAAALLAVEYGRDRETLERDSIATARAMAQAVDRELVSITAAAQVLSTSQRVLAHDLRPFYEQAQQVVAMGIGDNAVLSEASGQQLLNTLRPLGATLPRHGNPAQLRAVFEERRPAVSDLYVGGVLRRPVISVDVPVLHDEKVIYALSIGALPERFQAVLRAQKLPPGWIGAVFDSTGTIVARTHEHERFVGRKGSPELVRRMAEQAEGALDAVTLEGIPVVSAYSRSPTTGWVVALGIPRENLLAQLWQRIGGTAAAAALVLALGLVLAWAIGGRIARSIRGLAGPAGQIGLRERLAVRPLGLREADEVGRALMRASELIFSAEHRAHHDALTGLPNRALFEDMAARFIELCRRDGQPLALLFIDLDGFKRVNDEHGHEVGDRLLCAVAARLHASIRGSDVAARLGGDEFGMLLFDADAQAAARVAAKLVDTLSEPYELKQHRVEISASIGIAVFPEAGETAEELLRRADRAMYKVKVGGKRGHALS